MATMKTWALTVVAVLTLLERAFALAQTDSGDSWLNSIGENLHSELTDVLEAVDIQYAEPVINTTYRAKEEFHPRGMGPLYNATAVVIDLLVHKQAYPPGIVSVRDWHLEVAPASEHWRELLAHYAGSVTVITLLLLFMLILPLAGLLWCCCSLCRFGRRRRPFDRKYDGCLKGLLAILLIALLTLFLFGVVCAFTTDEQMDAGARELPAAARTGVRDAREYLNATQAHVRWLLVNNYQQLERKLNTMLDSSGIKISMQLGEFSRAASVTTLNHIVQKLDDVRANLHTVKNITARLRFNAEMLNSGLRNVKSRLLKTLATCKQPQCIRLQEKYKIGQLDTDIQYSQMPDVSELLNNVSALLDDNIQSEVAEGQKVFMNIKRSVENSVNTHIPEAQEAISRIGVRLREAADDVTWAANNASEWLKRRGEPVTDTMADAVRDYGPMRRYVGLAAASALLAITCLLALGLLCGVCGKRPDVYGANDCCNKGAGSKWLLCSMGVMFVVGAGVALVLLVYYVAGVAMQRFICDPLHEPRDNRLFVDLEQLVDLEGALYDEHIDPEFNLTYILLNCHSNHSIYQTLRLERMYDLDKLQSELEAELGVRMRQLQVEYPESARHVVILQDSTRHKLRQLADTGLSDFNFDRILQALETNITSLELTSLAQQLEVTAAELVGREGFSSVTLDLRDAAVMLHAYQRDIVRPMLADTSELNETALRLRDEMRFNRSSLKEAVSNLLHETRSAERFLSSQGPRLINNLTTEFSASLGASVRAYLRRVTWAVHEDVGRCGPVSAAYNATLAAACRNLLMPANGYWMSLAWCVVLFAPVMVVAQRLARLYLHVDPYPGPLVEAEYLYDAYADRDNIPLANAYKAEKRSRREARAGAGGGVGGGGGGGGAGGGEARRDRPLGEGAPPALDAHNPRRYNDMAPKHWEQDPPRYHGPTEYERPPPYYYPGPNVRQ